MSSELVGCLRGFELHLCQKLQYDDLWFDVMTFFRHKKKTLASVSRPFVSSFFKKEKYMHFISFVQER